ncbi:unnamed protein product [Adineta ricciae]|uniref:Uncharacterized protein n=1 Tax=Adineta ricciae TaxID=249248 RepID=A0A814EDI6_ADIRI|nr:unnamed protein product [Adineta ricciae]CAF0968048.1 unnamed protein product [Adineta ricciae]
MQDEISKTTARISRCTHRRLTIQHDIDENHRKQTYLSTLHAYKHQEQLFNRKVNHLRKCLEQNEPFYAANRDNNHETYEKQSLTSPNCLARVHNHLRLLKFSSETEKRLLSSALPSKLPQRRHSNQYIPRPSLPRARSCRSAKTPSLIKSDVSEQNTFQSYLHQQINDEQLKQLNINKRKGSLLKEFDKLKHTIDDPYATLSVLATLSRAFLRYSTETE